MTLIIMTKPVYAIGEQQKCRSACALAESDQCQFLFAAQIIYLVYRSVPKFSDRYAWQCRPRSDCS